MSLKYESCCTVAIMLFLSSRQDGGRLDVMNSTRGVCCLDTLHILYLAHACLRYTVSAQRKRKKYLFKLTNILKNATLIPSTGIR